MARKAKRPAVTPQVAVPAGGRPPLDPRAPRRARFAVLVLAILVLLLIFAVPRRAEPPPALDQPDVAVVDRIGVLPPDYATTTSSRLMGDPRYQMVVLVDERPPEGRLADWTTERATAWRIGAREDNGIALFLFREARVARVEVGYGLEDRLPDALVRRLLEDRLAPRLAGGDYQGGIDAFIGSVGAALGGDAELRKLWLELGGRPRQGTFAMLQDTYAEGIERGPRMVEATWRAYIEGGSAERLFVLFCVAIFLGILAMTVAVAMATVSFGIKLLNNRTDAVADRADNGLGLSPGARKAVGAVGLVFGAVTVALFSAVLFFALSLIGDQLHRKGDFSGAGAQVVWPAAS